MRLEKRLLKVLKGVAAYRDLLAGFCLHAFEGKTPFSAETLARVGDLKRVYGLDLDASDRQLVEEHGSR